MVAQQLSSRSLNAFCVGASAKEVGSLFYSPTTLTVEKLSVWILNNVEEHVSPTCVQSRLENVSRWRFDNEGWHPVPRPNDPDGEGGLSSAQTGTLMVQFRVMSSKVETGWSSDEFLEN